MNLPFAMIGGIVALWLTGEYLSVPASVGFINLFGVAVLNGIVLVSYFNKLREDGLQCEEAIIKGCTLRLRPVLMTALVALLGLMPLAFAHGIGSEVQRPLAVVVIGGLVSSTLLTLIVLPVLYQWFDRPDTPAPASDLQSSPFARVFRHPSSLVKHRGFFARMILYCTHPGKDVTFTLAFSSHHATTCRENELYGVDIPDCRRTV
jgi:predicted RND superfamily exporter protein